MEEQQKKNSSVVGGRNPHQNKHEYKIASGSGKPYRVMKPEEYKLNHKKYYYKDGADRRKCRQMFLKNLKLMKRPQRRSIKEHNLLETEVTDIMNQLLADCEDIERIKTIQDHFENILQMIREIKN